MYKKLSKKREYSVNAQNIIGILISSSVGTIITFIASFLFAFLLYKSLDLPEKLYTYLSVSIILGALASGYISSFKCKLKGVVSGVLSSIIFCLIVTVFLLLFSNGQIINQTGILYVLIIFFSALGGILGANTKRRKWGIIVMSKVIKVKKRYRKNQLTNTARINDLFNEKYKVVLLIFSIISMLLGSLLYSYFESTFLIEIISEKLELFKSENYLKIILFLIKSEIIYFSLAMFIGTSFVGAPLSVIPISLRCLLVGYIGAYMYNEFELNGVLFCLLFIYPYTAIVTSSLIFALNESIYMSNNCFGSLTNKNTADSISVKLYLVRYLFLIVINVFCAMFNGLLIITLINKINL